jgi:uncharacterized protein (DUF2141 family)
LGSPATKHLASTLNSSVATAAAAADAFWRVTVFNRDMKSQGAQRLPLAAPFPRAFAFLQQDTTQIIPACNIRITTAPAT